MSRSIRPDCWHIPGFPAEFGVVMLPINIFTGQIPDGGAHKHIRREMLLRIDPRSAYYRRHPVGQKFYEWIWILVRHHSGDRPRSRRMFGWKRCAALQEWPGAVALHGALTPSCKFESFHRDESVERRFSAEEAGFTLVLVVSHEPEEVKACRPSSHGISSIFRNVAIAQKCVGGVRKMAADIAVGC